MQVKLGARLGKIRRGVVVIGSQRRHLDESQ